MALLICSVLQVTVVNRTRVNVLMAALFFLFAYLFFYYWLHRTNIIAKFPLMLYSDLSVTMMIGSVGYSYIKSITGENERFSPNVIVRFLPALLVFCFFLIYNATGNIPSVFTTSPYPDYHSRGIVFGISVFADMWLCIYLFLAAIILYRFIHTEQFRHIGELRTVFYILTGITATSFLLFPAHYLESDALIVVLSVINGCFSVFYFIYSYRHPEYTQNVIHGPKAARVRNLIPVDIDPDHIMMNLSELMETSGIYRKPSITIQTVSNLLGISSNHLSFLLNDRGGENFRTFINRYRIEEAKKLLLQNPEKTVLEIAFSVGFNSKTAFNTTFTKTAGCSPTAYRKNNF